MTMNHNQERPMSNDKAPLKAWHFVAANKRLGYGDNRVIRTGRTHKVKGEPVLCERGLHASVRLIDALQYAPSAILTRVELGGTIVKGVDKVAATERTVLWMGDISDLLHHFACDEAERALKVRKVTDERSWNAIKTKRLWLDGKATDAELDAAWAAAWEAARDAARDAAWDAARAAARDAARHAAWDAARAAARDAARAAAWDAARAAARDAAWDAQNKRLTARVNRLINRRRQTNE